MYIIRWSDRDHVHEVVVGSIHSLNSMIGMLERSKYFYKVGWAGLYYNQEDLGFGDCHHWLNREDKFSKK